MDKRMCRYCGHDRWLVPMTLVGGPREGYHESALCVSVGARAALLAMARREWDACPNCSCHYCTERFGAL